jgi:hypothetical protein
MKRIQGVPTPSGCGIGILSKKINNYKKEMV